jgi:hypothetical protein
VRCCIVSLRRQEIWKSHFSSFTVGSADEFNEYLAWKRHLGVWGDDPEIQAMSEMYGRPVHVYAFHPIHGATILNRLQGGAVSSKPPIRWVQLSGLSRRRYCGSCRVAVLMSPVCGHVWPLWARAAVVDTCGRQAELLRRRPLRLGCGAWLC